jgi:ferrous iron transport protein B
MAGHAIEPVFVPLGWDWRIATATIASFPAREIIVATLGTLFNLGSDEDETSESLRETLHNATWPDGRKLFTLPVALSIMVFFALCMQCAATLMVIYRETGQARWPLITFCYMTTLAYIGALLTYQISSTILGTGA